VAVENELSKILFSAATIVAVIAYLLDRWIKRYDDFKKDVYNKIDLRVEKEDCKEFREREYGGPERRRKRE
jgi:hypothetical protein